MDGEHTFDDWRVIIYTKNNIVPFPDPVGSRSHIDIVLKAKFDHTIDLQLKFDHLSTCSSFFIYPTITWAGDMKVIELMSANC